MDSIYAPSYPPTLPISKPNPTESPSTSTAAPPMLIYAPNHMLHQGLYAPSHPLQPSPSGPVLVNQNPVTSEVSPTTAPPSTPKPKPTQIYPPVFAEAVALKTTTPPKTEDAEAAAGLSGGPAGTGQEASSTATTFEYTNPTTTTTTEAPKPGLIYVDSLARDVQNSFDGLVKNLPDILKGAKDAIGLLANLREIFAEEDSDG